MHETPADAHDVVRDSLSRFAFWAVSFLAPMALLSLVCAWNGVYPFGAESFLVEDMRFQYVDLFTWFRRVLMGEQTAFYQMQTGLGSNAWGIVGYYLSSPFNLLLPLFPEGKITLFFWVSAALKLGCAQLSATWYLLRRFGVPRSMAFALALSYVWCMWTATQLRNPMWVDALYLLPIAAYALHVLVRDGRWAPLCLALGLTIAVCWYTAYMIIVFLFLLFILETMAQRGEGAAFPAPAVFRRFCLFCVAALGAVMLAAFTFMPSVLNLLDSGDRSIQAALLASPWQGFFAGFFVGGWQMNVNAQHWAGALMALLAMAFACNRSIPALTRAVAVAVLLVMLASAQFTPLLLVWSGFRMPSGFFCRITFLTVFVGLWMAGAVSRELCRGGRESLRVICAAGGIAVVLVLAAAVTGLIPDYRNVIVAIVAAATIAAAMRGYLHDSEKPCRGVAGLALCCLVFAELLYGSHLSWSQMYVGYPQEHHDAYLSGAEDQLNELRAYDDGVYRADKTYTRFYAAALNEAMNLDYRALSTYTSSQDYRAVQFLTSLGYSNRDEYSVAYSSPILAVDALLGVRYVSSDTCPAGYEDVGLKRVYVGSYVDDEVVPDAAFYRNPLALPLGYEVSPDAMGLMLDPQGDPFVNQNKLFSSLLGEEVRVYRPLRASVENLQDGRLAYRVVVPARDMGYAYTVAPSDEPVLFELDGQRVFVDNQRFRHAAFAFADAVGDDVEYKVELTGYSLESEAVVPVSEDASCLLYALDGDTLDAAIRRLAAHPVTFDRFESGRIDARYDAQHEGYVLITVPAADGWRVTVNGQVVDVESVCDGALALVPVEEGSNQIRMQFMSPGFIPGCVVSIVTAIALIVGAVARKRSDDRDASQDLG